MGADLLANEPVFAATVAAAEDRPGVGVFGDVADKRYLSETTLALLSQSSGLPKPNVAAPATITA